MAKMRSIFKIQGTLMGVTMVNSKRYGRYVRAARGTWKEANVNKAFKEASMHLQAARVPAQIIKNAIALHRECFEGGYLWQRLLSLFCRQHKQNGAFDFFALQNMEVHESYPLARLWEPQVRACASLGKSTLHVLLSSCMHPVFAAAKSADGYRVQVVAIFPNLAAGCATHSALYSPVIPLGHVGEEHHHGHREDLSFDLPLPDNAGVCIICIKLEGMVNHTTMTGDSSKGMRIVKVIALSEAIVCV
jgi:hypothetical protein